LYLGAGLSLEHALDAVHFQQYGGRDLENVLQLVDAQLKQNKTHALKHTEKNINTQIFSHRIGFKITKN